jgi:hypothetical protein
MQQQTQCLVVHASILYHRLYVFSLPGEGMVAGGFENGVTRLIIGVILSDPVETKHHPPHRG